MAAGANRKRKRKPKTSNGVHGGAQRVRLGDVEKVLLGGGALARTRHVTMLGAWRGVANVAVPFDAVQAKRNRHLYPELLGEVDG